MRPNQDQSEVLMSKALKEIQRLKAELNALKAASWEPIAIVGMACRFPGNCSTPEAFWKLLRDGQSPVGPVPKDRWDIDHFYDVNPKTPGRINCRDGAFLSGVDQFDPLFFNISPREAEALDPQQRILLEVGWEALEDAGWLPDKQAGRPVGVFIGISGFDYALHLLGPGNEADIDPYCGTGTVFSTAAGRLSYTFGLTGPCLAVDTACSSSLVAIHLACQSLRQKECEAALVGGVNLILGPSMSLNFSQSGLLASDGKTRTFDAQAAGYTRGEGCGVVLLKRLCDAVAEGDRIWAVLRGSAVNQDGHSGGLTVPSGSAQREVVRTALRNAGIEPHEIHYIEAHGTATPLGDPIEVQSLGEVFSGARKSEFPIQLGSVKTNLGHLEAAAGMASLFKVVLALAHEQIPPHLHLENPNPDIDWGHLPFVVTSTASAWKRGGSRRLAGVSSFGFSGTNAHLIVEEAPQVQPVLLEKAHAPTSDRAYHLLCLSAKQEPALREMAQRCLHALADRGPALPEELDAALSEIRLADVAHEANVRRVHFSHRLAILARDPAEACQALAAFGDRKRSDLWNVGKAVVDRPPSVGFLFTGQGSQYPGMGARLYATQPVFREALDRCEGIVRKELGFSILEVMHPQGQVDDAVGEPLIRSEMFSGPASSHMLDETQYAQPALYALEAALVALWASWGIRPDFVMGHSLGEYVAAYAAGVFTLEDGLRLVCERGRLVRAQCERGEMATVFATEATVAKALSDLRQEVFIAALNGPEIIVLSGTTRGMRAVLEHFKSCGIRCVPLRMSNGFHSGLVEPMMESFADFAAGIRYRAPQIPLISNLTGQRAGAEMATPGYWLRHLREPVRFARGAELLLEGGVDVLVEIGPDPVLSGLIQCLPARPSGSATLPWLPSLQRGQPEEKRLLRSLGQLYTMGAPVDWSAFDQPFVRQGASLPHYPFQRKRYWRERRPTETPVPVPGDGGRRTGGREQGAGSRGQGTEDGGQRSVVSGQWSEDGGQGAGRRTGGRGQRTEDGGQGAGSRGQGGQYQIVWQPRARPEGAAMEAGASLARRDGLALPSEGTNGGVWLIFADRDGLGSRLAEWLKERGDQVVTVERPGITRTDDQGRWQLVEEALQALCMAPLRGAGVPIRGVVHLWSLDAPEAARMQEPDLEEQTLLGCGVLHWWLRQSMEETRSTPLWLVTRGAAAAGNENTVMQLLPALILGMGEALAVERPGLAVCTVDLPPVPLADEAQALGREIFFPDGEDRVALRAEGRYAARLEKEPPGINAEVRFKSDATYCITGGWGGLGLLTADWMIRQGARRVILIGRSQPSSEAQRQVDAWRTSGIDVWGVPADVADRAELGRVLSEHVSAKHPLKGIVHAAGIAAFDRIATMSWGRWLEVQRAKVYGAWNLHELTRGLDLDYFVVFSSMTSVWGAAGLAHYASANRFLDALAQVRCSQDLPGLSLNWGAWRDVGMHDHASVENLEQLGIAPTRAAMACQILSSSFQRDKAQRIVVDVRWDQFLPFLEVSGPRPFFDLLRGQDGAAPALGQTAKTVPDATPRPRQDFRGLPAREQQAALERYLQEEIAGVLGLPQAEVPVDSNVLELGINSLMIMEVFNHLRQDFDLMLYPREFYEHPVVRDLAGYLVRESESRVALPRAPAPESARPRGVVPQKATAVPSPAGKKDRLPPVAFIFSSPRAGSTLLRAMLAGHSRLFAPPELYLLPYETMGVRAEELRASYLSEGLQRCLMELLKIDAAASRGLVEGMVQANLARRQVYSLLQGLIGDRMLIDKSPGYAAELEVLRQAEEVFEGALYIHLVRHPYAVIESVIRTRMDKLIDASGRDAQSVAETNWLESNENILEFLRDIEPARQCRVVYEDLARDPAGVLGRLCEFLGIPFEDALLRPYDGGRMTDGLFDASIPAGDPNFQKHDRIDPRLGEVWKTIQLPRLLSASSRDVAARLGYELPREKVESNPVSVPLSFAQQRLWFLDQLEGASATYNATRVLYARGTLEGALLREACTRVMKRHVLLRTAIVDCDGIPVQRILEHGEPAFTEVDLRACPETELWAVIEKRVADEAARVFDWTAGALWRITLVRLGTGAILRDGRVLVMGGNPFDATGQEQFLIILAFHHSAYDGYSLGVLYRELSIHYEAARIGEASPLPPLVAQYADYAAWQRSRQAAGLLQGPLDYWKAALRGAPARLDFPGDAPRPAVQTSCGSSIYFEVEKALAERLNAMARDHGASLFTVLFAAFQALLSRTTGKRDIVTGTLMNHRPLREFEALLGMCVNTLALRTDLSGDPTFVQLLDRINKSVLEAHAHQDAPFELLVEQLQPERSLSYQPIFQVLFALHNALVTLPTWEGIEVAALEFERRQAKFDLNVILTPLGGRLMGVVEYNTDLFHKETVGRLIDSYLTLLEGAAARPSERLSRLPVLTPSQHHRLLRDWNDTRMEWPDDASFITLFEKQAVRTPDRIAVVGEKRSLTYRELNRRSESMAAQLAAIGLEREGRVGLLAERGESFLIGLLATWKCGATYLPLDPHHPPQRMGSILAQAGSRLGVVQESLLPLWNEAVQSARLEHLVEGVTLENLCQDEASEPARPPVLALEPNHLAYVIFTSGSTGAPKGAMVEEAGMVNHLWAKIRDLGLDERDIVAQNASQCFDISVWQFLAALVVGGSVRIYRDDVAQDPERLFAKAAQEGVTVLEVVPSVLRTYLESEAARNGSTSLGSLRWLILTGEALPPDLCREWLRRHPGIPIVNAYGPTECSDDVTHEVVSKPPPASVLRMAVGRPIANLRIYILDDACELVPEGVFGELYVAGTGVGRGYLGRPDLTAAVFLPDPFSRVPGERLYRTGDLGRYLADGSIEFAGRIDHQVKVRGFRIELGEIEAVLRRLPGVRDCVVADVPGPAGSAVLVGYLAADAALDAAALGRLAAAFLPEYMVPSVWVKLDALPVTPNGKLDRAALPQPEVERLTIPFCPPRNSTEELLCVVWKEVLRTDLIGIDDHFFAMGGHSLLAVQIISRLRKLFQIELEVRRLFEFPTIRQLAAQIEMSRPGAGAVTPVIPARTASGFNPLSFAQERLWFLDQMEEKSSTYNMSRALRLRGALDAGALEGGFRGIISRHEALRTTFQSREGTPFQEISERVALPFVTLDLRGFPEPERWEEFHRGALADARTPFDLAKGPMLRVRLCRMGDEEHLLAVTLHHIISDGWSLGIFMRELSLIYRELTAGSRPALPPLAIHYADYALWQRTWLAGDVLDKKLRFWLRHLEGAPAVLELPFDSPRPAVQRFRGSTHAFAVEPDLRDALDKLIGRHGSTPFMVWQAAFALLLFRYSGQPDIVLGLPVANRQLPEIEPLIGFFVNTLALRTLLSGDPTFEELLVRVRDVTVEAYEHQDLPFELLVEALQPKRNLSHSPVFQVMFVYQNAPAERFALPGVSFEPVLLESNQTAKFDLMLTLEEKGRGWHAELEYNTDLFRAPTIERMAGHLLVLVRHILCEPWRRISECDLLTQVERTQLLVEWNRTERVRPAQPVHELFDDLAREFPNRLAVEDDEQKLTYHELNIRANRLAWQLIESGVGLEMPVALLAARSADYLAVMLAVFKAGGAFQGLDPSYPPEQLGQILQQGNPALLVVQEAYLPLLARALEKAPSTATCKVLVLETSLNRPGRETSPPPLASLGNTAYLMYTSGTTGLPKGAMIEHGGMLNHLYAKIGDTGMSGGDVMAQTASQRFDIFIYQFLAALVLGGRTRIYRDDTANDPGRLFQASDRDGVTLLEIVPSLMGLFLDDLACGRLQAPPLRTLRWLIPTGEALPPKLCRLWFQFYPSIPLLNAYGHTETSDDVAHFAVRNPPGPEVARMSIGKPVPNTKIYILDSCLLPVPIGVVGRLYIGGAQVGRGYLNRPELTAAVFLPDPFSGVPGARFYDSGDQGRFLPDGCIDYLGRLDHMVKIRGNRVELGEIEAALLKHPDIRSAVVLAWGEGHAEEKELVAYVCLAAGTGLASQPAGTASVLIGFLKERLPSFMIPGSYVFLECLPLTPNGKVDRKALVRPDRSGRESGVKPIALRTVTEAKVATIWREVLKRSEVGPTDDFFEIGGHSLLATQVASRIRKEFGIELPIRLLFEIPVLSGLADWLDQQTLELADPAILEAILEEIDAVSDEESAQPLQQPHD